MYFNLLQMETVARGGPVSTTTSRQGHTLAPSHTNTQVTPSPVTPSHGPHPPELFRLLASYKYIHSGLVERADPPPTAGGGG